MPLLSKGPTESHRETAAERSWRLSLVYPPRLVPPPPYFWVKVFILKMLNWDDLR